MSDWKETILDEFVDSISETFKFNSEPVVFLNTSDILSGKFLHHDTSDPKTLPGQAKKRIKKGDFLFSEIRPINKRYARVTFEAENYVVSTKLMVLRSKGEIEPIYLEYFLTSDETLEYLQMIAEDRSGTFPQITFDIIKRLEISLPPLSEQRAIASILSSLNEKIDLLHHQNQTLEQMAETLFRQWFVKEADDGWKNGVIGDWVINQRESIKPEYLSADIPYVAMEHISKRNTSLTNIGNSTDIKSNKYKFEEGDILFGKLRPYFHKVCFAPFSGVCSTDILVIRPKKPELLPFCLFAFFQDEVIEYATAGSGGTRMPRTNWNDLSGYPFLTPPHTLVQRFNEAVKPFLQKIKTNQTQIRTLNALRDTLLPKLMSGEVNIT